MPYKGMPTHGVPARVKEQVLALNGKAFRLSFTTPTQERDCMLVLARNALAVLIWAQRDLRKQGYTDFCVGGYRGGKTLTPALPRAERLARSAR